MATPVVRSVFKESFKYYKSRKPLPDLRTVIDLYEPDPNTVTGLTGHVVNEQCFPELGLKPVKEWKIYEFLKIPGLIFIRNPFTADGQRYWMIKCLKDYTRTPSILNLNAHDVMDQNEAWWNACIRDNNKTLLVKLRWATLGYHYNWETKLYSEEARTKMPAELAELTICFARALGFNDFTSEAGIINYYRMNSTLSGHTDHSEANVEAPLFSISFGQTGLYLMGGLTLDDPTVAMYLRSGDILIMSRDSRLRYHGIPKILPADIISWCDVEEENERKCKWDEDDWDKANTYLSEARINVTIRQVLKPGQTSL